MAGNEKKLGVIPLAALVVSAMIGGGIFSLPQNMAQDAAVMEVVIAWIVTGIGMPHVIRSISPVITAARNLEHPCKVIIQLRGEVALHRDFRCGAKVLVRGSVPFNPRRFRAYPAIGVQRSRLRASIARFHDTDSAPELILIPLPITSENKRSIPPGFIGKCNLRPPKHQTRHRRRSHDERPPRHAFALSGLRAFSAKAA